MGAMQQSLLMGGYTAPAGPLLPEFVEVGTFAGGINALSAAVPTWYADGDLLVLVVGSANQTIATPSGWTQVSNSPQGTGTGGSAGGVAVAVFYKIVSGAQSALSVADSGNYTVAQMLCFRKVDTSTPIDVTAGSVKSSATGTTFTLPSVTTTADNDLVLLCVGQDRDLASTTNLSSWTNANLANILERIDQTIADNTGGGIGVATGEKATAGSTGTTSVTSAAATTAAFLTVALKGRTDYNDALRMVGAHGTVNDVTYSSNPAAASVTLNTDGSITNTGASGEGSTINDKWLNYLSSGAGSSYWVRATANGGSGSGSQTGTTGTWLQLNSARTWEAATATADTTQSWFLTFDFSTSSSGTPIVGSSRVELLADCNSGAPP